MTQKEFSFPKTLDIHVKGKSELFECDRQNAVCRQVNGCLADWAESNEFILETDPFPDLI